MSLSPSTRDIESATAKLLSKLTISQQLDDQSLLDAASEAGLRQLEEMEAAAAEDDAKIAMLRQENADLEAAIAAQEEKLGMIEDKRDVVALKRKQTMAERADLEWQIERLKRDEEQLKDTEALLAVQLTVHKQLHTVAESLAQVASRPTTVKSSGEWVPDALRHREREVEELKRALKRQQLLTTDAHRQILEISTRRKPMGAAGAAADDVDALRAAVAEQEMRRMIAEAQCDELKAQVRLFEEQSLRSRLHPAEPLALEGAPAAAAVSSSALDAVDSPTPQTRQTAAKPPKSGGGYASRASVPLSAAPPSVPPTRRINLD